MKNTFYYALLILGTAGMLTGFYAIDMDATWRYLLANSGIVLLTIFYIATVLRIYRDRDLLPARRTWLFTTLLLPVFGGILFLIMQQEEALD
ncbi:PLDc N-terminal domain-containing protein [Deminuibacter soli]|uniref:Cardiolipin synthase N-terminal domain-containing protein n=1 Tax=Deminuibacter soli TaxID=2291815 RepID=A0A3E1NHD9_9BACT|nr:PLDc N-terminal domain-containing protein [Deminuibacter soli]RFM27363.1 hypothetical protein DXN05_15200 [Deminuibacter soli]